MAKREKLTDVQKKALRAAIEHGYVEIGKGFGQDTDSKTAIAAGTYRTLLFMGLLTSREDGTPFDGSAITIYSGKVGFITAAGRGAIA